MNITIIQPPLVQLNTPYPSGAYLLSFFNSQKDDYDFIENVKWLDTSNLLFHQLFSSQGLSLLFSLSENRALKLSEDFEKQGDEEAAFQIRRYISCQKAWILWIDRIVEIVCGGRSSREYVHEFVRSPHVPRGMRMENFLYKLEREVTADDAQFLASFALADLADYITMVFDPNFRLISYAEKLGTSEVSFDNVIEGLDGAVLKNFYSPVLEKLILPSNETQLFLISVPFPGCFEAAVFAARFIKEKLREKAIVCIGGGYVNTELRTVSEKRIFDYADYLSYDMGYGSYLNLFDEIKKSGGKAPLSKDSLPSQMYKMRYLHNGQITEFANNTDYAQKEEIICRKLVPDFTSINFENYPRLADDVNPMHRIWNDGSWIKCYLAHGCYWHRCAFCDTSLEYVNRYCKCDAGTICSGLMKQAEKTGVYGIHFVDEACPPSSLIDFSLENCRLSQNTGKKLTFWGNIRFEKSFNRDLANFLSYGGLTAVSAGIEIATGEGLDNVNKGTTIENIVKALCAFKEAGILVHSYMIFGFYNQTEQDLINSMETLRQLFKAGLLDSAFWHKFTLTLHSTVYKEKQEGKHKDLKILNKNKNRFAENDLNFEGENKSDKYSDALNLSLDSWMHGKKLEMSVNKWFNFNMPRPSISQNYIDKMIEAYEKERDYSYSQSPCKKDRFLWLGGKALVCQNRLLWTFMGEPFEVGFKNGKDDAKKAAELLNKLCPENSTKKIDDNSISQELYAICGKQVFKALRQNGLSRL